MVVTCVFFGCDDPLPGRRVQYNFVTMEETIVSDASETDQCSEGSPPAAETKLTKPVTGIIRSLNLDQAGISSRPLQHRRSYLSQHLGTCNRMYSTDLVGHHGCVNAMAISRGGEEFLGTGRCCACAWN